jgi:phosphoenolpyruvate-protein kinase (PTS system EI component)
MFALSAIPYVPGQARGILRFGPAKAAPDTIVVIGQHELAALNARPAGIALMDASPLSHPTLRLRSEGIPTVLVEQGELEGLNEGDEVLLDGRSGLVSSPIPKNLPEHVALPPPEAGKPVATLDGVKVELRASVGSVPASAAALAKGATSIGLVRSEYLFPEDGSRPDAGFLATAFAQICQAAQPLPVCFRLVDIASDKKPPWVGGVPGIAGVLGLQGARLYATEPVRQVYRAELEALRRLSGKYQFSVLLPFVTSLAELENLVGNIRSHLPPAVPVGVMLETPAAALAVHEFLSIADFAAIGCNDLMQCLFAADRDLPELRSWLDLHAPVLYRFLDTVSREAGSAASTLQVCGLLPQWPATLPILLGMGYRTFSVDPIMIPCLAEVVRQTDTGHAARLAQAVCQVRRPQEVKRLLAETNQV